MTIVFLITILFLPWVLMDLYYLVMGLLLLFTKGLLVDVGDLDENANVKQLAVILIPTYNNHVTVINGIAKSLNEALNKNGSLPLDVILVDSSTDGSHLSIANAIGLKWSQKLSDRSIASRGNCTLIHLSKRQGGKSWALNQVALGLDKEYFAVLDSDWVFSTKEFIIAARYLGKNPDLSYLQLTWQGNQKQLNKVEQIDQISIDYRHQFENRVRSWRNIPITIHGSAFLMRTEDFKSVNGFRENVLSEDVDLATRLMLQGRFGKGCAGLALQQNPCDHVRQFFWQKRRWVKGRSQLLRQYCIPILKSRHMTVWQKTSWLFYLGYFGRFPTFLLMLLVAVLISPAAFLWIGMALLIRLGGNLIAGIQKAGKIEWWPRIVEPFWYYGFGLVFVGAFFSGLFWGKGEWHAIEHKTTHA